MRVLAIIPARGGSKGVPRKNIRSLAGRPLIAYTIEAARAAQSVDRVVVSTEDDEITRISTDWGAEVPFLRPLELSGDATPTLPVLQHVVRRLQETENYQPDAIITLQPTSPLRTAQHIEEAIALFSADRNADSLVSCVKVPHIFHPLSVMRISTTGYLIPYLSQPQPTRRQEKEKLVARNGAAIYITNVTKIEKFIFGGNLIPYFMDPLDSLDIDNEKDFCLAEATIASGSHKHAAGKRF